MPKTLLLADDSVVIQKLVGLSFANEEVELITIDNGDDAIIRTREQKPDLVLADVVMPGKSGYEVCEAIKADPELRHIPVMLLTGTFEAFDEEKANAAGSDGHITKPFEAQVLVERVNELLSRPLPAAESAAGTAATADGHAASDDAYDFFDDNNGDLAGQGILEAKMEPENAFSFGSPSEIEPLPPIDGPDPLELGDTFARESGGDRTIALMPEPFDSPGDLEPLASPAAPGDSRGATSGTALPPARDPGLTILHDELSLDAAPLDTAPSIPNPVDPAATVLADSFGFDEAPLVRPPSTGEPAAFAAGAPDPAATVIADDLFGGDTAPPGTTTEPEAFEFGLPAPAPASAPGLGSQQTVIGHLGGSASAPAHAPDSGFDLGSSPDDSAPIAHDVSPSAFDASPTPEGVLEALALPDETPPVLPDVELEHELTAPVEPTPHGSSSHTAAGDSAAPAPAMPDLAPMIRERLHETLEKVAWEAFADISDTVVRQVIEKVEAIAWEVIPQMAESLIQEEIRRMKGESS